MTDTNASTEEPTGLQLGTFIGVFTPTILTILGVIMYLRFGWVVGNVGLGQTLLIVLLANLITLLTSLSLSALATNMQVGVGGAYYLISRSFGLEVGGAIGIPLYLSQTLSLTLYAYGLAESFMLVMPTGVDFPSWMMSSLAAVIVLMVTLFAARSTELALKLQRPIMVLIFASIFSLLAGSFYSEGPADPNWITLEAPQHEVSFWAAFAVFFPAVTGILAGVSLSGDLKDPRKAIPNGVLSAVSLGLIIYLIIPVALAWTTEPEVLRTNSMIWNELGYIPFIVIPAVWGAIISSAFGSILGAPRTLQALAADRLVPHRLGQIDPKTGEPTLGLYVSGAVALGAVFLGDLNIVAEWLTIFFLTTYGALNAVAALENLVGDPYYRPQLTIPWWASGLGAAGCILAMFAINPSACIIAITLEILIFYGLSRKTLSSAFGDARSGLWLSMARFAVLRVRATKFNPRNWRPNVLVFARNATDSLPTIALAEALSQHRGFVTLMSLIEKNEDYSNMLEMRRKHEAILAEQGLSVFCEVTNVHNLDSGILTAAQAHGFAGLDANTIIFGIHDESTATLSRLLRFTRQLGDLEKCTIIYRHALRPSGPRDIIVWWKGKESNGDLMLLLAHLLSVARGWEGSQIVLKSVVDSAEAAEERQGECSQMLTDTRIRAKVEVVERPAEQSFVDVLKAHSKDAGLVFLGLPDVPDGDEETFAEVFAPLIQNMPPTALVRNAGPFRGHLLQ